MLLGEAIDRYVLSKTEVSAETRRNCKQRLAVLVAYFSPKGIDGRLRDVATISAMNLMEWRFSLKERKERYAGNHYRMNRSRVQLSLAALPIPAHRANGVRDGNGLYADIGDFRPAVW